MNMIAREAQPIWPSRLESFAKAAAQTPEVVPAIAGIDIPDAADVRYGTPEYYQIISLASAAGRPKPGLRDRMLASAINLVVSTETINRKLIELLARYEQPNFDKVYPGTADLTNGAISVVIDKLIEVNPGSHLNNDLALVREGLKDKDPFLRLKVVLDVGQGDLDRAGTDRFRKRRILQGFAKAGMPVYAQALPQHLTPELLDQVTAYGLREHINPLNFLSGVMDAGQANRHYNRGKSYPSERDISVVPLRERQEQWRRTDDFYRRSQGVLSERLAEIFTHKTSKEHWEDLDPTWTGDNLEMLARFVTSTLDHDLTKSIIASGETTPEYNYFGSRPGFRERRTLPNYAQALRTVAKYAVGHPTPENIELMASAFPYFKRLVAGLYDLKESGS